MKRVLKKSLEIITVIACLIINVFAPVIIMANGFTNPVLQINNVTGKDDSNYVTFYDGDNLKGKLCVRESGTSTCLQPTIDNGRHNATFNFDTNDNIEIVVEEGDGYFVDQNQYSINGESSIPIPGDKIIGINNLVNDIYIFDISFVEGNGNNPVSLGTGLIISQPRNTTAMIDPTDSNRIVYKLNNVKIGSAKVKVGNSYIAPVLDTNGEFLVDLLDYDDAPYIANIEVTPEPGYSLDRFYSVDGVQSNVPNTNILSVNINNNIEFRVNFDFIEGANPMSYPIVAYFEGINGGILVNDDEYVVLPDGFTTGDVTFKAKVCDASNGAVIPNNGMQTCTNQREIPIRIEGIVNGPQINDTARPITSGVKLLDGFNDYGKASIHITQALQTDPEINKFVKIITEDLINVSAEAPIGMSYSLGSSAIDQAIFTRDNEKDVSVFFGNTETTLVAEGINVEGITSARGTFKSYRINSDGSATIIFPELNEETTTTAEITIRMTDGTLVKKTVHIMRTAVLLQYQDGGGDNSVYAGYVVNKGYLYNNQSHSDNIFNAYLQVMLYKDDVVVGYKQVKINDESLINNLHDDESGSLELYSNNQIPVYGKATNDLIDGVNKVSVFLTDGPVSFDSDLPPIEFGIGSGVTLEWGAN